MREGKDTICWEINAGREGGRGMEYRFFFFFKIYNEYIITLTIIK